ncbi:MAG: hypothetical protein ABIY50_03680, partial [Ignavibacteria bacterium]
NLMANSNFNSGIGNWSTWPAGSQITSSTHPVLDAGVMRIDWTGVGNHESFTMSSAMSITKGNYYQASLSCVGPKSGTFSTWGMSASISGFPPFFPKRFLRYENYRINYSFVFKADTTDNTDARFSIDLVLPDSLLYVDNVNLYRVNVSKLDSSIMSKLFVNVNSTVQNISLNGTVYKDLDGNLVTGSISLDPYSSRILINDFASFPKTLQLTVLPQGLYNSVSNSTVQDTVTAYLRNSLPPYNVFDSSKAIISSAGLGWFTFPYATNNLNYYLAVTHRNSIETWSKNKISFQDDQCNYDFTTSVTKAYGNNLISKGSKYCIYSGDVDQDDVIDGSDVIAAENAAYNFAQGYLPTDVNGDNITDAGDVSLIDNNAYSTIFTERP